MKWEELEDGARVRIRSNGHVGTVVSTLSGYALVRVDGSLTGRPMGYEASELETVAEVGANG
jgi:hypothetical protein